MQRFTRSAGLFLCLFILCFFSAAVVSAEENIIDTSHASEGYFTVYSDAASPKMKVGVVYGRDSYYYDYVSGETMTYALDSGSGTYRITLYCNVTGTLYRQVATDRVNAIFENDFVPFLVSTTEITFSEDDAVGKAAREVCEGLNDAESKVLAIRDYISENISYDYDFASDVSNGIIKTYIPNTADVLVNKKGICYDFAVLFAAMCRSQGIPCFVEKGYYKNKYHAWNQIYVNNKWYSVDLTIPQNNVF